MQITMNKKILFLAAAVAVLIISSCTKEETKDKRVAVFLPSSETVVRWKTDKECLSEALGAMNLDYSMQLATDGPVQMPRSSRFPPQSIQVSKH